MWTFGLNSVTLIGLGLAGLLCFGAGWVTSGWKHDSDEKEVLINDIVERDKKIADLAGDLQGVIANATTAVNEINEQIDGVNQVVLERNAGLDLLDKRTKEIANEIAKLDPAVCVFAPPYRSMYREIGNEANAGRDRLYAPTIQ